MLLLLALVALLGAVASTEGATVQPPAVLHLAAILPATGARAREGAQVQNVLELMLADINGGVAVGGLPANLLGSSHLQLVHGDSQSAPLEGMRALHQLYSLYNQTLFGVFGCINDDVTLSLDMLASSLDLMLVSPLATTVSLGNLQEHPYFWRTALNDAGLAQIMITVRKTKTNTHTSIAHSKP